MKLKEVLSNAKIIMAKNPSVKVLGMVVITVKDGKAIAQSCDLDAYYQGWIDECPDVKDGVYSLDQKGVCAVLAGMKIENVLTKFDIDEMPIYPEMTDKDIKYEPASDEFINALVKSCTVAKIEDARTWTNGVHVESGKVISTNGRRLMLFEVEHKIKLALIPALYLQHLAKFKFIDAIAGIGKLDDKKYFVIMDEGQQLAIELIDAKFPDWTRVIPADYKHKFIVERKPLIKALKGLEKIFRPFGKEGTEWREDITLAVDKAVLNLNITTKGGISEDVSTDCQNELNGFKILVNVYYLMDALNNATEDAVEIHHATKESFSDGDYSLQPILIESSGYKHVVMPIRPYK